ncbi:UNVERIFIED_CONTAM: hypothetical protein FKN15_048807 [Acipenser sinensis]
MRALDPLGYEKDTLQYFKTLKAADPMRSAYFDDLRSKFVIENSILKMEYAETRVVDLSKKVSEQELAFPFEEVESDSTSPVVKLSLSAKLLTLIKRATAVLQVPCPTQGHTVGPAVDEMLQLPHRAQESTKELVLCFPGDHPQCANQRRTGVQGPSSLIDLHSRLQLQPESPAQAESHMELVTGHLHRLGLKVNHAKSQLTPSKTAFCLGLCLDSRSMLSTVHGIATCLELVQLRALTVVTVQRLLGFIAAASQTPSIGSPVHAPSTVKPVFYQTALEQKFYFQPCLSPLSQVLEADDNVLEGVEGLCGLPRLEEVSLRNNRIRQ